MNIEQTDDVEQQQITLEKMAATLRVIPDAIAWISHDQIQWCNPAFERLVDRPQSEILHAALSQILPLTQAGQPISDSAYPHLKLEKGHYEPTVYDVWREEHSLSVFISGEIITVAGDCVTILLLREVIQTQCRESKTPPEQTEQERETFLSLAQATLEATADAILVVDRNRNIPIYNQKFLQMWSIPESLLQPGTENERLQFLASKTRDPEAFIARVWELFRDRPHETTLDLLEFKDGRIFERYSQPQWNGDQIIGRVWSFRDVTEQKRSEEALRRSELKYRNIFENSQIGIGRTCLADGLFLDANQRCAEIMGYASAADLIGKHRATELYAHLSDRQELLEQIYQHGEIRNCELQMRRADGQISWVLLSVHLNLEEQCLEFVLTDISVRKRLEEELRQSQRFLDTIIETIPLALFVKDIHHDFRYVVINRNSEQILGFPREGAIGRNDADLLPKHYADMHRIADLKAIEAGPHGIRFEQWLDQVPQTKILVQCWKVPIYNRLGEPTHLLGISENITERWHQEQALRLIVEGTAAQTGSEFFRACVRYLAEVLRVRYALITEWMGGSNGRVRTLAVWGGEGFSDNLEYDVEGAPCRNVYLGRICYYPERLHALFPDDEILRAIAAESYLGVPLANASGQILGHLAVLDVKPMQDDPGRELILRIFAARAGAELERKQTEEALQRRAQIEHLLSNISRQFIDQDLNTATQFTLRAIAQLLHTERSCIFEYTESQRQFQLLHEWCAPGIAPLPEGPNQQSSVDMFPWLFSQILSGQAVQIPNVAELPAEAAPEKALFEEQLIQSTVAVPMMHSGKVVGMLALDVIYHLKRWSQDDINLLNLVGELIAIGRARHQAEAALREAKEAAEAANRAKSTFLANMSHELRTPLNAILGFAQLMERDPALTARQRQSLVTINRSGEHLLDLINDVLEMSKIEAGRTVLDAAPFNLHSLLQTIKTMFQVRAATKHLSLQFELAPDLPENVLTDEGKLRQVLINLLGNAVKFTDAGRIVLRARASKGNCSIREEIAEVTPQEAIASPSYTLFFEVEDTGQGIAPEEIDKLFQPFVQTTSGTQTKEGTGLGLTISRQFVRLMGGDVYVKSQLGQGSTFYFDIQIALADSPRTAPSIGRVVRLSPDQPTYRILIVDDRAENRELIVQLLESVGFETRTATQGEAAIALWQQWHPHLIWMDMRMPVMDGYEATRRIREAIAHQTNSAFTDRSELDDRPIPKIIALTASAFEEQQASILAAGCDDLVCKPFQEHIIFEKLAQHLGVRYLYQQDCPARPLTPSQTTHEAPHLQSAEAGTCNAAMIQVMSSRWVAALERAAQTEEAEPVLQLIEQIPEIHTSLMQGLLSLLHQGRFAEIAQLAQLGLLNDPN